MRELCESAKRGRKCNDDLCRGMDETLCGFDQDLYDEVSGFNEEFQEQDDDEYFDAEE